MDQELEKLQFRRGQLGLSTTKMENGRDKVSIRNTSNPMISGIFYINCEHNLSHQRQSIFRNADSMMRLLQTMNSVKIFLANNSNKYFIDIFKILKIKTISEKIFRLFLKISSFQSD